MTANLAKIGFGRDGGAYYVNDPDREASAFRDDYYTRDGGGVWKSTGNTIVRDSTAVSRETFQDLCAGIDPRTGKRAVRGAGEGHRAGWDLVFACPKSISLLWATASSNQRRLLEQIQREAADEAIKLLQKELLLEVRSGAGGVWKNRPSDVIIGQFQHYTSREGDPHLHVHNVIMNVAGCADKKCRTLEPKRLYDGQLLVGAAFRSALGQRLVAEGFHLRPAGRDQFELAGFPEACLSAFSKRSEQIEEVADRKASAAQKQLAALQTRQSKADLPTGEVLQQRWHDELERFGIDPWTVANAPPPSHLIIEGELDRIETFDQPEIEGSSPVALAASRLFRTQSVITRTELLTTAFSEASLRGVGIDAVYAELERLEEGGKLTRLEDEMLGRLPVRELGAFWTTPNIAACEATMLRSAARSSERTWITSDALKAALLAAPHLSVEQRDAVFFAASTDGVSIIEAGAGTGKTTLARALTEAARGSGLRILALAPSWVAADEIGASIGVESLAIAKWRHDQERHVGAALDEKTIILVDEAGMVGTMDMSAVLAAAVERGSKVVLLGDRRQLQSVAGANALAALSDLLERQASLSTVRRQIVPWQRAASTIMARGDCETGLRTYALNDRVDLVDGEAAARAKVIATWTGHRTDYGEDALIVTRRNSDAALLNREAREVLRAEGRLTSDDIIVSSIDREKKHRELQLAVGDRVRFGETLSAFRIRNGTRATVSAIVNNGSASPTVAFTLEDGRSVADRWDAFSRKRVGRAPTSPRISHGYAGTAYAAQGRTVSAAVMYVCQPTDARELYVGLTRHIHDARLIVERTRLDAAVRTRQADPRLMPSRIAILERLFTEAQLYAEKHNVIDFVEDRAAFMKSGLFPTIHATSVLNFAKAVRSIRRAINIQNKFGDRSATLGIFEMLHRRLQTIVRPLETRIRALLGKPVIEIKRSPSPSPSVPHYDRQAP
ncbi:MobF family relaxase [Beijerinckia sp. L45]|uniref:MobF family relaxase n=1 Tax=Beijerinckia sp. L45 TaxID=1641855 RepID=UPI00131EC6A3|nr:MobF family relaxase [Beijerinckia sp. L45]